MNNKKGFSGLDDLSTDVDDIIKRWEKLNDPLQSKKDKTYNNDSNNSLDDTKNELNISFLKYWAWWLIITILIIALIFFWKTTSILILFIGVTLISWLVFKNYSKIIEIFSPIFIWLAKLLLIAGTIIVVRLIIMGISYLVRS